MGLDITITRTRIKRWFSARIVWERRSWHAYRTSGSNVGRFAILGQYCANRYSDSHLRIVLDAEDFRERRRKTLEDLSDRLAGHVIRTKKEVVLEPMSSHERKIIHAQLQNHARVKTLSKGDEPNRRVVISLKVRLHIVLIPSNGSSRSLLIFLKCALEAYKE